MTSRLTMLLAAALLCAPLAAAQAAGPHTPVSSDGKELQPAKSTGNRTFVPGYKGTSKGPKARILEDALANAAGGQDTREEMLALLAIRPMTAPKGVETIIGPDQRKRMMNTQQYPFRAIVLITFNTPQGASRCTGWMINKNTVATAGHCVSPGNGSGFYGVGSYKIFPGRNGVAKPYGVCGAKRLDSVTGWVNQGRDDFDYGAIKLKCNIGTTVGWFGFFWQKGSLNGLQTQVTGYPGDKPMSLWRSLGKVTVTQPRRVFYKNDTVGGMSGSPVYYKRTDCGFCGMAVHAYGTYNGPPFSANNHGTRITQGVFKNFNTWRAAP